jgi:hypothetical protein
MRISAASKFALNVAYVPVLLYDPIVRPLVFVPVPDAVPANAVPLTARVADVVPVN